MATAVITPTDILTELEILELTLSAVVDNSGYIAGEQCIYNIK